MLDPNKHHFPKVHCRVRRMLLGAVSLLAAALLSFSGTAQSKVQAPNVVDVATIVADLSVELDAGNQKTVTRLERLGFGDAAREVVSLDNRLRYSFSSRTLIETLRNRAELAEPGVGGDRFLRVLYDDAASRSAALASSPDFEWLRARFSSAEMDLAAKPISFASMAELVEAPSKPLPKNVVLAIAKLSDQLSEPNLSRVRFALLRRLNMKPTGEVAFENAIARSTDRWQALATMVQSHSLPPRVQQAIREILGDLSRYSAALKVDGEVASIIRQLSAESELPPELVEYANVDEAIPSRERQLALAAQKNLPGNVSQASNGFDAVIAEIVGEAAGMAGSGVTPAPSADSAARAQARAQARAIGAQLRNGGGRSVPLTANYRAYTSKAFSGVSRKYVTAVRLPSLARGIALGGALEVNIDVSPIRAVWERNDADSRFGRLFVEFGRKEGWVSDLLRVVGRADPLENGLAVSRVMFTDSFLSALAVLSEQDEPNAVFREGDLVILMSMDPDLEVSGKAASAARAELAALQSESQALEGHVQAELEARLATVRSRPEADALIEELQQKYERIMRSLVLRRQVAASELPRGVVLHPGIQGREIAWTTTRVDFWFNDLEGLSVESARINGGEAMPNRFQSLDLSGASTWQFYERDHVVSAVAGTGAAADLRVSSSVDDGDASFDSHFSVSMFAYADTAPPGGVTVDGESGVFRLPKLERDLQPMLDWLATSHHDFIRLNHFAESLALLRWLRETDAEIVIMDLNAQSRPIATPDRVLIGDGPGLPD